MASADPGTARRRTVVPDISGGQPQEPLVGLVFQLIGGMMRLTFMFIRLMFQLMFMVVRGIASLIK